MEANLSPAAPATEPPESGTTPKAPAPRDVFDVVVESILAGEPVSENLTAVDPRRTAALALTSWRESAHRAVDSNIAADKVESTAFASSKATNEAGRKADAKAASAALRAIAEHDAVDAQATARLLDLLIGPSAVLVRR